MINAILIGIWAFLFSRILNEPGQVFAWWPPFIRFMTTGTTRIKPMDDLNGLQYFAINVLYACAKCGSFWWWVLYCGFFLSTVQQFINGAILTIFIAFIIDTTWDQLQNRGIV